MLDIHTISESTVQLRCLRRYVPRCMRRYAHRTMFCVSGLAPGGRCGRSGAAQAQKATTLGCMHIRSMLAMMRIPPSATSASCGDARTPPPVGFWFLALGSQEAGQPRHPRTPPTSRMGLSDKSSILCGLCNGSGSHTTLCSPLHAPCVRSWVSGEVSAAATRECLRMLDIHQF